MKLQKEINKFEEKQRNFNNPTKENERHQLMIEEGHKEKDALRRRIAEFREAHFPIEGLRSKMALLAPEIERLKVIISEKNAGIERWRVKCMEYDRGSKGVGLRANNDGDVII